MERDYPLLTPKEANAAIKRSLRRRLVVVGGCIGTDAHTVGIDAILNIKGFAGEKGLEYYRELKVVNLGAQVSRAAARRGGRVTEKADAVLVSQVVTQRDAHLLNTREMSAAFREAYPAGQAAAAGRRRSPLRRDDGRRARRRPRLQPGYDARRGRVLPRPPPHRTAQAPHERRLERPPDDSRVGTRVTHRRYVPYSPRPLRRQPRRRRLQPRPVRRRRHRDVHPPDGDEGLFASYSDVQFRAPVRAGDVLEITATWSGTAPAAG